MKNWFSAEDWVLEEQPARSSLVILEGEETSIDSGLLDAHGNKLYRRPTKDRIGFKWTSESETSPS